MADVRFVFFDDKFIETTICDSGAVADAWIRSIGSTYWQPIIAGLDCEWRPNTSPYMNNRTATLQICVDTKCLILQLIYMNYLPQSLMEFLSDPDVTFVGVEVARDAERLRVDYGLYCRKTVDVRELALSMQPDVFRSRPGLQTLAYAVVGLNMTKPTYITRSDWQSRTLSHMQIEYACIDAYASSRIGLRLLKRSDSN